MGKIKYHLSALLLFFPVIAQADVIDTGNTAWLMTSTALVLFMTLPGLSLFYAGLVRSKNVLSVLMQCFAIGCLATIVWLVAGYSLSFADGGALNAYIGGLDKVFFAGIGRDTVQGASPESVFFMFQLTFAIITPALIIGGFAERMRFSAILLFSLLWLFLVYFPLCHQVWGGGWLAGMGLRDFAGGTVVHITAGVAALVAAMVVKARHGFTTEFIRPHNLPMTVMGAGMLWVGWFGFNGGSALAAGGDAGMAILVTHISAAVASLVWMLLEWLRDGKPSVLGIVTGMVAGLGTITPASGYVGPVGALIIGLLAGGVCFFATMYIKRVLKIDDSLDVFPVHGVGGILGTLLLAVFSATYWGGVGYDEGVTMMAQLKVQAIGVAYTIIWTAVLTYVALKIVALFVPLRVSEEDEVEGLDITQHEERGYNL